MKGERDVKKVVPVPGTLEVFLEFVEVHRTELLPGNEVLEEIVETRPTEKPDLWT